MTIDPPDGSPPALAGRRWEAPRSSGTSEPPERAHRRPRWLTVLVVVVLLVAVAAALGILIGGGEHGPSRHGQSVGDMRGLVPVQGAVR